MAEQQKAFGKGDELLRQLCDIAPQQRVQPHAFREIQRRQQLCELIPGVVAQRALARGRQFTPAGGERHDIRRADGRVALWLAEALQLG